MKKVLILIMPILILVIVSFALLIDAGNMRSRQLEQEGLLEEKTQPVQSIDQYVQIAQSDEQINSGEKQLAARQPEPTTNQSMQPALNGETKVGDLPVALVPAPAQGPATADPAPASAEPPPPQLVAIEPFEILDPIWVNFLNGASDFWRKEMSNNTYSGAVSNNYARNGQPSYRVELRKTDPIVQGSKRSEISVIKPEVPATEHVYKFSTFLPNGGSEDYAIDPFGSEIIAQWHNTPDAGEPWTSPPLALHTGTYYNQACQYTLERNWDASQITNQASLKHQQIDLGSFVQDKGKWVNWRVDVKWGWSASQHPYIRIYKDNVKIYELIDSPNATNDNIGIYMKLGIYKWDWAQTAANDSSILSKRVIYYSNVSVK